MLLLGSQARKAHQKELTGVQFLASFVLFGVTKKAERIVTSGPFHFRTDGTVYCFRDDNSFFLTNLMFFFNKFTNKINMFGNFKGNRLGTTLRKGQFYE